MPQISPFLRTVSSGRSQQMIMICPTLPRSFEDRTFIVYTTD